MKILVTGFDPFGGEKVNPAIEAVKRLPDTIAGAEVIKLEIPTVVYKSLDKIDAAIKENDPDFILSIGQAGGRPDITVERVGINCNDCRIPDNEGNQPVDEPVYQDGPDAYFSLLPIKAIVADIQAAGIPASVSDTAGTFICNHVLYGVRYICEHKYPGKKSGFIHIPYMTSQAVGKRNVPSMAEMNSAII
jgi:pyroglutamyl-peptidase I